MFKRKKKKGISYIRYLNKGGLMSVAEAKKERLKEWLEGDDDFAEIDNNLLPDPYHQI